MATGAVTEHAGRWPANILLDEIAAHVLDAQSGELSSGSRKAGEHGLMGYHGAGSLPMPQVNGDRGGAARFFYTSKASGADREAGLYSSDFTASQQDGTRKVGDPGGDNPRNRGARERLNCHPTVKPTDLMRWLCRLVTPPGGLILDPFMGSGSTGVAAMAEGFRFVGVDLEPRYVEIAERRLKHATRQPSLFDLQPEQPKPVTVPPTAGDDPLPW